MDPVPEAHHVGDWDQTPTLSRPPPTLLHFIYTEKFEGGAVYTGISAGRGKFIPLSTISRAPCVVFVVDKDRSKRALSIDIQSYSLRCTISNALDTYPDAGNLQSPDLDTLLKNYDTLKHHLETLESQPRDHFETSELRLLVEDFLQDSAIFDGMGLEQSLQTQTQLNDTYERCIDTNLDILDDCFHLRLFSFDVTDDHLAALNRRYAQLALSDDFIASDAPCEPRIRSEGFAQLHDPPEGAEMEHPASYGSFSNLSLRIKESDARGLFTNGGPDTLPDAFHNGSGTLDPETTTQFSTEYGEPPSTRSGGVSERAMNGRIPWGTGLEPGFCGARANPSRPVASVSATAFHDTPRVNETYLPNKSREGSQPVPMLRQRLGRNTTASLTNLCRIVCDTVGKAEPGSLEYSVSSHFKSIHKVWNGGLGVFRQIINNHPPRGLAEVLDCIIVANSMCTALGSCNMQDVSSSVYIEFVGDIGRWRSILDPGEHALFDRISYALWRRLDFEKFIPGREDHDGLARFQEALQDLVTLEKESPKVPPVRAAPYASRLGAIQRKYTAEEDDRLRGQATSNPMYIPIPGGDARKRVLDESPAIESDFENNFSINDVFDVDLFLAQSVDSESTAGQMMDLGWNDILSTTVLLLASSAFSIFLTLTTVIHRDFDSDSVFDVYRRPPGYSRSCDILGYFLESGGGRQGRFRGVPLYRPHSLHIGINRLSLSTMSAPSTRHPRSASSWANPAPDGRRMRASASAVPRPSPFTTTQMAHSFDAVRDPKRLRCLSASCSKNFSSVSNRNKHMREGCPHREKTGYKCRNENCTKVLTTKWYRKTHEQGRCRYRGLVGVQGSGGGA